MIALLNTFHGLTLPEIESLLRTCSYRSYEQGQRVYGLGDTSDELLILLSGRLSIRSEAGDALAGQAVSDESIQKASEITQAAARPISDMRGTAEYRTHLTGVLTRRVLNGAVQRAKES